MLKLILSIVLLGLSSALLAAGPLVLEGPSGNTPAKYANPNITMNFDMGTLGTRSNDQADQRVRSAFSLWNGVATSTIVISQGSDMPVDVTSANFTSYIPDPNNNAIHNDNDGLNPVVYDDDGTIIDAYFGTGQGSGVFATVVGFASSSIFIGATNFTEGFAVMNGNINIVDNNELSLIIAHEIGHFMGLDHTQVDIDNAEFFNQKCPTVPNTDYPLMYPYACRKSQTLHPDDDVSLSMLYPDVNFNQNQGQITGTFTTTGGEPVKGANLWVQNTANGDVYSIVSDYLKQCTGFFALMLPPGNYTLHANSINNEFNSGSSVGPWAEDAGDASFQAPASSIGSDVAFDAGGVPPAIISLAPGKSTNIVFRTDGSGSFSGNNDQVDLAQIFNSADSCGTSTATGGGGGGSITPLMVLSVCAIASMRRKFGRNPG